MHQSTPIALDQIILSSPFGIAVFNYAGEYESVNPTYCAIYGYSAEELLGRSISMVFPPESQAHFLRLHQQFLDEGGVLGGEWEVVRRDQTRLQVISESVRVLGQDGHKRRLVFVMDITQRQQLELALKRSEERLSLVLLGTEDGYFDVDLLSGKRTYSDRWWHMLGYAADAWPLDGQHWQRLTHPDDLERVNDALAAAMHATTSRFELPVRLLHQDGHYRNILCRAYIGRDAAGRAVRLTGANTDLTARMRIEQEARHFQSIVENSSDAIISKSLDSTVTSWNAGAQAMYGYSADEMLGRPITVLLPPDRQNEEELTLARLRAGETVEHFDTVRVGKGGRVLHVSVTISPIRDPSGRTIGASNIARDISERKALEAKLLLTASVFSHTQEGILVLDPQGTVVEVNPALSHITGYTRAALLGQNMRRLVPKHCKADLLRVIGRALAESDHYQGEHWCQRTDQRRVALLVTASVVRNAEGAVQNTAVLLSDITPLRMRQEQLEHLAHHDALTDLPNRVLLADRIGQSLIQARRQGFNIAVLYIDLDGFKQVNDQHGHATGDALLVALALRMKDALREVDTLARVGGDEFAAVLADVKGMEELVPLLQRLLNACAAPVAVGAVGAEQVQVSASMGVALYPHNDVSAEQLLSCADHAMYLAKQAGKNQYRVFEG